MMVRGTSARVLLPAQKLPALSRLPIFRFGNLALRLPHPTTPAPAPVGEGTKVRQSLLGVVPGGVEPKDLQIFRELTEDVPRLAFDAARAAE